jgi:hypothetical protein
VGSPIAPTLIKDVQIEVKGPVDLSGNLYLGPRSITHTGKFNELVDDLLNPSKHFITPTVSVQKLWALDGAPRNGFKGVQLQQFREGEGEPMTVPSPRQKSGNIECS